MKASDKHGVSKKLVTSLKKRYKGSVPKQDFPVLETMLYAICLENASPRQAETAYERLREEFHDLNEVRVSSIAELEVLFEGMEGPEWRAMRVRNVLQYVFEKQFAFEIESLRRKTLELAVKQLGRVKSLTPFVRAYTLQAMLGAHVVPIDDHMQRAAVWLGLVPAGMTQEEAGEALKSIVRKAETAQFCHLLRKLANDPKLEKEFSAKKISVEAGLNGYDLQSAPERLAELFKSADRAGKVMKKKPAKPAGGAARGSSLRKRGKKRSAEPRKSKQPVAIRKKK